MGAKIVSHTGESCDGENPLSVSRVLLTARHQRCIRMRWNHEWEIMGRTLGAGPSVGHPFLCETTTLRTIPVANSSEWTRTWLSCVAHSTKAALIVPGGLHSTQSLPVWRNSLDRFDELHTAGERVK